LPNLSSLAGCEGMAYTADKAFGLIEAAHDRGRLAHAFLITGPAGSGKASLAARIVQMVNPADDGSVGSNLFGEAEVPEEKSLDELEGDLVRVVRPRSKSRRITVDDMRGLEKSFHVASAPGKWKVGVVLGADRMGAGAENAFLKTLEEPPPECLLLLVSDAPELLLPTVLSRCVKLPLMALPDQGVLGEASLELLSALASMAKQGIGSMQAALTLRASFSAILARKKSEISKCNDAAFKEESKKYKNTTDSGDWLKNREKYYLALTESEYLNDRERLIETLVCWVGDVVRQKCSVEQLDFPSERDITASVASSHTINDLLHRMEGIEQLRANLETNVQEQLALEVAFLTAFG
jgi:DNA polymerase-3 subunit delta'